MMSTARFTVRKRPLAKKDAGHDRGSIATQDGVGQLIGRVLGHSEMILIIMFPGAGT